MLFFFVELRKEWKGRGGREGRKEGREGRKEGPHLYYMSKKYSYPIYIVRYYITYYKYHDQQHAVTYRNLLNG